MSSQVANKQRSQVERPAEPLGSRLAAAGTLVPDVDILESEDRLWLWVDMPGVDVTDLDVRLDRNLLIIRGRTSLDELDGFQPVHAEHPLGNFERRFRISDAIDSERIEARVEAGVLELVLPKSDPVLRRRIEVTAA